MPDKLPEQYEKANEEIKETVDEIIKFVKEEKKRLKLK